MPYDDMTRTYQTKCAFLKTKYERKWSRDLILLIILFSKNRGEQRVNDPIPLKR